MQFRGWLTHGCLETQPMCDESYMDQTNKHTHTHTTVGVQTTIRVMQLGRNEHGYRLLVPGKRYEICQLDTRTYESARSARGDDESNLIDGKNVRVFVLSSQSLHILTYTHIHSTHHIGLNLMMAITHAHDSPIVC